MEKFDLFDLIEAYLDGTLPEEKRREVERRMAEDEIFRREVELHQELQDNFSDPGRWRLRSALAQVMEEGLPPDEPSFKPKPSFSNSLWKWIIFFGIVLVGIVIWYWLQSPPDQPTKKPGETQPTVQPSAPGAGVKADTIPVEIPKESVPPKQKPKENSYIAEADPADFIPNPSMEALVSSGLRSFEGLTFSMTSPSNSAEFTPDKKGETSVRFAGVLEGPSGEPPFEPVLAIFNNKDVAKPLISLPLELKKDAVGSAFEVRQRLKFLPGLYYFTIEQDNELMYAGKFTIGGVKK
ncbi:MAG: hypothetical protein IPM82_30075 [Saprospiraceae bacterium]|nr:hypothetical protein [Saprospiraceae bacterium]